MQDWVIAGRRAIDGRCTDIPDIHSTVGRLVFLDRLALLALLALLDLHGLHGLLAQHELRDAVE